jgi:hypothetical protein
MDAHIIAVNFESKYFKLWALVIELPTYKIVFFIISIPRIKVQRTTQMKNGQSSTQSYAYLYIPNIMREVSHIEPTTTNYMLFICNGDKYKLEFIYFLLRCNCAYSIIS